MSEDGQAKLKNAVEALYRIKHDQFKTEFIHTLFVGQMDAVRSWHEFVSWFLGILGVMWGVTLYKLDFLLSEHLISRTTVILFAATSLSAFLWKYALVMVTSLLQVSDKVRELMSRKAEVYVQELDKVAHDYPTVACDVSPTAPEDLLSLFASQYPNPMRWYLRRKFKVLDPLLGYKQVAEYHQTSSLYMLLTLVLFVLTGWSFYSQLVVKLP